MPFDGLKSFFEEQKKLRDAGNPLKFVPMPPQAALPGAPPQPPLKPQPPPGNNNNNNNSNNHNTGAQQQLQARGHPGSSPPKPGGGLPSVIHPSTAPLPPYSAPAMQHVQQQHRPATPTTNKASLQLLLN